jgi:hypothetical protein
MHGEGVHRRVWEKILRDLCIDMCFREEKARTARSWLETGPDEFVYSLSGKIGIEEARLGDPNLYNTA